MKRPRFPRSPLHTALWVDATFELVGGTMLLALRGSVADWLNVDRNFVSLAGAVFLVAAIAIAAIGFKAEPSRSVVSALAAFNALCGVVIWCVVASKWSEITPEGRWLVAAAADSLIAVALLEFLA
ncbi:MAG: hypothetical protein ABIP13_06750, partial [Tepidiformaceae bacterium]